MRGSLILLVLLVFSGCGSEMKLAMRAAESEKDQPSAALVRKIEVAYRDPSGQEKMRQSIAVTGMSQPVSVKSDLLKDLEASEGGTFEARAFAGDGLAVLRGAAQYRPDESEVVEIVLGREAAQAGAAPSSIIRKIRVANVPMLAEAGWDGRDLKPESVGGQCIEVPVIRVSGEAGLPPSLVVETLVKAPVLFYEVGGLSASGAFAAWRAREVIPLNDAANASLILSKGIFGDRLNAAGSLDFQVRLYSNQYEGCMSFRLRTVLAPPIVRVENGYGVAAPTRIDWVEPLACRERLIALGAYNPNDRAITVSISVSAVRLSDLSPVETVYTQGGHSDGSEPLEAGSFVVRTLELPAKASAYVNVHGIRRLERSPITGGMNYLYSNRGLQLRWTMKLEGAAGGAVDPMPPISRVESL